MHGKSPAVSARSIVNRNVRFMFDYLHGDVARQLSAINTRDAGSKFEAFAMRTQIAF